MSDGVLATARAVADHRWSAADAAAAAMRRIVNGESGPDRLHAFISYDYEAALAQAERVDVELHAGRSLPLAGVALAVKDNICTLGLPTTCASRILANYRSPYEATAVRRLRAAGAIVAGKTNLDEFAMGSSTEHSAFGPTLNPHDRGRVPGGSSGGSAAAVAAGMVAVALGSDTGGSVRQPAAFCGVVGFKPSYGAVSRYGLAAFASSLDQIGVISRDVPDAAAVFRCMAGRDARDARSRAVPLDEARPVRTVGVPREYVGDDVDPAIRTACAQAIERMKEQGIEVRDVSLPHTAFALRAYTVIACAEASTNLARYDGVRYGTRHTSGAGDVHTDSRSALGPEVRRRILLGTFVLSADQRAEYFALAQRARAAVHRDFERVFASGCDLLFTPTTPTPAFRLGERVEDAVALHASDRFTAPASLAGLPALSLPVGRAAHLPLGAQLIGPHAADAAVLGFAARLEEWLAR